MNKVLLSICVLLIAQTSFAGHHEKSEQGAKTIIGYEILDGERLEIVAGKSSNVDIWVEYVEAHNKRDLETINRHESICSSIIIKITTNIIYSQYSITYRFIIVL